MIQPATLILHADSADTTAFGHQSPANLFDAQPQPKQAYFTHLLPDGLTKWRAYRATAQQAATCFQQASFIRYMAKAGRYPRWTTGVVTTQMGAIKLVNFRKQYVIPSKNLVASILDDRHASLDVEAKKLFDELKALYTQQNTVLEPHQQYSFKSAVELATKLIECAAANLDAKLRAESDLIKKCPEAALLVGIPTNLVLPEVLNSQTLSEPANHRQRENTFIPKPATFADMLKTADRPSEKHG